MFLAARGFHLVPKHKPETHSGYMTEPQKQQFIERLANYPSIQTVAEIGFNGGHSAEVFFTQLKNLKFFASFDINKWPYTPHAVEYFQGKYGNRFFFVEGDSLFTVPLFANHFIDRKFDLIYIDGCHQLEWVVGDIRNARAFAHSETILWIDDVRTDFNNPVYDAICFCEKMGWISLGQTLASESESGKRAWVEARYL